jgi:uncharacterized protein (DUF1778 family)
MTISAAVLQKLVLDYRSGHPDATPDALARHVEDAAQTFEHFEEQITVLGPQAWDKFCKALDGTPRPSKSLVDLMRGKSAE